MRRQQPASVKQISKVVAQELNLHWDRISKQRREEIQEITAALQRRFTINKRQDLVENSILVNKPL